MVDRPHYHPHAPLLLLLTANLVFFFVQAFSAKFPSTRVRDPAEFSSRPQKKDAMDLFLHSGPQSPASDVAVYGRLLIIKLFEYFYTLRGPTRHSPAPRDATTSATCHAPTWPYTYTNANDKHIKRIRILSHRIANPTHHLATRIVHRPAPSTAVTPRLPVFWFQLPTPTPRPSVISRSDPDSVMIDD